MKIQSHELTMKSQHIEYRSILESSMSFETFFTQEAPKDLEVQSKNEELSLQELDMSSHLMDEMRTINDIIQSIIAMLQERKSDKDASFEEDGEQVVGYTHMSFYEKYEEFESLEFSTIGHIQTEDASLDINLNFSMTRSFAIENRIDLYTTFDPLVINLEGAIPDLNQDTFSFDLDNDGEKDQISTLGKGNGFLALDKNHDGKINQGSELFGTLTGDGFGELSQYDEDHNSWIDENDSIFDSLQVWLKNQNTDEKELVALGEVGIGAIYLNSQASEFTYKTAQNQTLGEMKSSGVFLYEDGRVGNISQIDFASRKDEPLAQLIQA